MLFDARECINVSRMKQETVLLYAVGTFVMCIRTEERKLVSTSNLEAKLVAALRDAKTVILTKYNYQLPKRY